MDTDMIDTLVDTTTGAEPTFDREALLKGTLNALARLEKLYEAVRRKLQTAKTAEEFIQKILEPKRALLQRMFSIGITIEDIADLFAQELAETGIELSTAKLLKVLPRLATQHGALI